MTDRNAADPTMSQPAAERDAHRLAAGLFGALGAWTVKRRRSPVSPKPRWDDSQCI